MDNLTAPFSWMISSYVDLEPGFYTSANVERLIPTDNVRVEDHFLFWLNVAHLQNRYDNETLTEKVMMDRTDKILVYYDF